MSLFKEWRLWAPMTSGFLMSALCPIMKDEGITSSLRPPSYVFKIVWPILYILLGLSWTNTKSNSLNDWMHGVCTFLLTLWIYVYNCKDNKRGGAYIIACLIAMLTLLVSLHEDKLSKVYLTPLIAWLTIAYQLNLNTI